MKLKCYHCKKLKDTSEFYVNTAQHRGYAGDCKECFKKYRRLPRVKRMSVLHSIKHWRKVKDTEDYKKKQAKYRKKYYQKYTKKYKHKLRARWKLRRAIRDGKMKRGNCMICGKENAEAHHDDYSKPYEVKWFCKRHHIKYEKN